MFTFEIDAQNSRHLDPFLRKKNFMLAKQQNHKEASRAIALFRYDVTSKYYIVLTLRIMVLWSSEEIV